MAPEGGEPHSGPMGSMHPNVFPDVSFERIGTACVLSAVCTFPEVPYSQLHLKQSTHGFILWDFLITQRPTASCPQPGGAGAALLFIIAFVESSHQLMDNHHKVDRKMDYLTPQTDNKSFIILRLPIALSSKPHGRQWELLRNILIFDGLNNLFLFYCHLVAAVVLAD